jgi:hypothetical protein
MTPSKHFSHQPMFSQLAVAVTASFCTLAPVLAQTATPEQLAVDAQVLRSWQLQTGQSIRLGSATSGPAAKPLEFHGQVTTDVYNSKVLIPSGNPALTPAKDGNFGKLVFQGDVRNLSADQDTTYAQGVFTSTDDRGLQPRYSTQINNLQVGRSGAGYQIAFGDVVAGFSSLSSNLGLRGGLANKDLGALAISGFAGTVAESWEALSQQQALDGLPERTRLLRDVLGLKVDYRISSDLSAFVTLQNYHDRAGSAAPVLGIAALDGTIGSVGGKYSQGNLQLNAELAYANKKDPAASTQANDTAIVVDGTYRINSVGLRFGHHNLGADFTSLAQTIAPGLRETYVGADWQMTPQLLWGVDLREAATRLAATAFFNASQSTLDSLYNRIAYNLQDIPGAALSLSDTRSRGVDVLGNDNSNTSTQVGASYANAAWSLNALLGRNRSRNQGNVLANSDGSNWQLFVGRTWDNGGIERQASWSLGVQSTAGSQVQSFTSGTSSRSYNLGLNLQANVRSVGTMSAGWQGQTTTQPIAGAARLTTHTFNLDWTKNFGLHWSAKAYAKVNRRNHGDVLLQTDEQVLGVQAGYKW